ncbi:MAG: dihydropteroate synthase [Pseudomonadota bacterium]
MQKTPLRLAHDQTLEDSGRGFLMGVLNVTPDSFSDGGRFTNVDTAVTHAAAMASQGAAIIDIGAESTRPGATPISGEEERARLLPVIRAVAENLPDVIISADTYRAETAVAAVEASAHIINDVQGLQGDTEMAKVAAVTGAGLMVMHTNRIADRKALPDPIEDQREFFQQSLQIARANGVADAQIILDPGFGFGKDAVHNFTLMKRMHELTGEGDLRHLWWGVGTSRKRMIGHATGRETAKRDVGTAATTALLRANGVNIFRVHEVEMNADALNIADATLRPESMRDV